MFIIKDEYYNENLDSLLVPRKPFQKMIKLYHGDDKYHNILKPVAIDFGNAFSEPGWSLFCWKDKTKAIGWAVFQSIRNYNRKLKEKTGIDLKIIYDAINDKGLITEEKFNILIKSLKNKKLKAYIYDFYVPINKVGIGNDSTHDEYTVRDMEISDYKLTTIILDKNNLYDYLNVVNEQEFRNYKDNYYRKVIGSRGLLSLFLTREFSYQKRGKNIKPDTNIMRDLYTEDPPEPNSDINKWMKDHDYKFYKIGPIERAKIKITNKF